MVDSCAGGGSGRLGLLDSRACGHGVGAYLDALLILLGGLGSILALNDGLLDDTGRLVCRDGLAALERPGAGATGDQQRQRKSRAQEPGEITHRRSSLGLNLEP